MSKCISIYLNEELLALLKNESNERNISFNELTRTILIKHVISKNSTNLYKLN